MKEEFNLSEKIVGNQSGMEIPKILESTKHLLVKDVKEFIKRRFYWINLELSVAKDIEVKRALIRIKAELEKDAGDKLI